MAQKLLASIGNFPMYVDGVVAFLVCQGEKYNSYRILQLCNTIAYPNLKPQINILK